MDYHPPPRPSEYRPASLHPLDKEDRVIIEGLLATAEPSSLDIVQAARLVQRYKDSLLSSDLYIKLQQAIERWGMTIEQLFDRSRSIWMSGWRPTRDNAAPSEVGSGADVES